MVRAASHDARMHGPHPSLVARVARAIAVSRRQPVPASPDPTRLSAATVAAYIRANFEGVVTREFPSVAYFSVDPQRGWPAFAIIETGDGLDETLRGLPDGSFRLSVMVGRNSFEKIRDAAEHLDPDAPDVLRPHESFDDMRWVAIVNPTVGRFNQVVAPRLVEGHAQLVARRAPFLPERAAVRRGPGFPEGEYLDL